MKGGFATFSSDVNKFYSHFVKTAFLPLSKGGGLGQGAMILYQDQWEWLSNHRYRSWKPGGIHPQKIKHGTWEFFPWKRRPSSSKPIMTSGFLYESFGGIYWRFIFNQSVSKLQPLVLKIGIVTSVDLGGLVVGGSQQIFKAPGPKATKNLVEVSWLLAGKLSNFNQHWIFRADFLYSVL